MSEAKRISWHPWEIAALHEAGHAVVAAKLGCIPQRVELTFKHSGFEEMEISGWTLWGQSVKGSFGENGEEIPDPRYCHRGAIVALAGSAVEEMLTGERDRISKSDEQTLAESLDALRLPTPEERSRLREYLTEATRVAVDEALPDISNLASELLRRVDQVTRNGPPLAAWTVAIEGEELRQLLV